MRNTQRNNYLINTQQATYTLGVNMQHDFEHEYVFGNSNKKLYF